MHPAHNNGDPSIRPAGRILTGCDSSSRVCVNSSLVLEYPGAFRRSVFDQGSKKSLTLRHQDTEEFLGSRGRPSVGRFLKEGRNQGIGDG